MKTAAIICALLLAPVSGFAQTATQTEIEALLNRMKTAYSAVSNYQVNVEVKDYWPGAKFAAKRFLYTFEKNPEHIRMDFRQPYPGMVIVYPDKNGEVVVQPFKWAKFIKLHLSPDSSLLRDASGQPINQTDLGALIQKISRSLTVERRGPVTMEAKDDRIEAGVLAPDEFRKGVTTRYLFIIDKSSWLPAGVEEWSPDNTPRRKIYFRHLRINITIPKGYFNLNGG
jgi:outer membrane lipoprotein-sorting protein